LAAPKRRGWVVFCRPGEFNNDTLDLWGAPDVNAYFRLSGSAGQASGFSLHAGVAAKANQGDKLERLCRYITRPAISEKRLSLTNQGKVRYELKTPYRDGTTHVIFEPVDFIAKLAALVPRPRVNLTRFHGVFAPNSKHRALVTPAKRGKGSKPKDADGQDEQTPVRRHAAMTWAQRLKRVFTKSRRLRRYRHRDLQCMWWRRERDRLHRRPGGH